MDISYNILNSISELLEAKDNNICIDCGVNQTKYLHLDFGSLICQDCLHIHLSCFSHFTYKSIDDNFLSDELKPAKVGGNTALKEYWAHFDLNLKSISFKYATFAAQWYKMMIKKLAADEIIDCDLPSLEVGRKLIDVEEPVIRQRGGFDDLGDGLLDSITRECRYINNYFDSERIKSDIESNFEALKKSLNELFN